MSVCICTKHLLVGANEGTCLWCGHGEPWPKPRPRVSRLPRDLGAILREGKRLPRGVFENVVRAA